VLFVFFHVAQVEFAFRKSLAEKAVEQKRLGLGEEGFLPRDRDRDRRSLVTVVCDVRWASLQAPRLGVLFSMTHPLQVAEWRAKLLCHPPHFEHAPGTGGIEVPPGNE
jgi:hypothetical protein